MASCAVLLALVGCGPAPAPPNEITLWALGVEGEVVAGLVPAFERAHPGLRVRIQQIPWSAAHEKLLTAFVGESLPDVFQLGVTWIPEFAALGALEPLSSRADALRSDHFDGVWDANVIDGALVALPWYVDTRLLFQRRDLFAAAGVSEMPRTWDAWRDALAQVQHSLGADRHALFAPPTEWELPVVQALSRGASLLRDGDRFGNFQSDAFRAAFAFHLSLYERGLAARGGAGATASLYRDFAEGWFASFLSGPWNLGQLAERLPPELADAWATAPVPGVDADHPGVSIAGGASLAIRNGTPKADAAWKLVAWLAEPTQQIALYRSAGDLPPRRSTWADPALADDARVAAFRAQLESVRALPKVPEWERIAAAIGRHTEAAIRGETPPDAALAALDRDVDRILQKRRQLGAGPEM